MSKKLLIPFLTEWLIKYGTDPIDTNKMGAYPLTMLIKASRKGYIVDVMTGSANGLTTTMKLTKEGVKYLQENQK